MTTRPRLVASLVLAWFVAAAVDAAPTTFEFTATVDAVQPAGASTGIAVGMQVTGSYTFESGTASQPVGYSALYANALASFSVDVPAAGFSRIESVPTDGASFIQIWDAASSGSLALDAYVVEAHGDAGSAMQIVLGDASVQALDSVALALTPPDLASFESATLTGPGFTGVITSLTLGDPEKAGCQLDLSQTRAELFASALEVGHLQQTLSQLEATLATCQARRVYADADGDGEEDSRDACPASLPGTAVDAAGCSLAQFCGAMPAANKAQSRECEAADFGNDEPGAKSPRDCRALRSARLCISG